MESTQAAGGGGGKGGDLLIGVVLAVVVALGIFGSVVLARRHRTMRRDMARATATETGPSDTLGQIRDDYDYIANPTWITPNTEPSNTSSTAVALDEDRYVTQANLAESSTDHYAVVRAGSAESTRLATANTPVRLDETQYVTSNPLEARGGQTTYSVPNTTRT